MLCIIPHLSALIHACVHYVCMCVHVCSCACTRACVHVCTQVHGTEVSKLEKKFEQIE